MGSAVHKFFLKRLLVVLQVYNGREKSFSALKYILSFLPEISLDPRDWYAYAIYKRDLWRERILS
jgi:hypothetical protein